LYVASDLRRRGVASALLDRVLQRARDHFKTLHVRTYDEGAGAFYESRGFLGVDGDAHCTHRRTLDRFSDQ
jgi:GNAT superfamily N-acetyltransferase